MPICVKCNKEKDVSSFYFRKDNLKNRAECKDCTRCITKKNFLKKKDDPDFILKERERGNDKYNRLYKSSLFDRYFKYIDGEKWKDKFPEKTKAADSTKSIRKDGHHCHHWSYLQQHRKDVIYLTPSQHMKSHRFIIYDQERMMYRRFDTNELLDTKEKHEAYIKMCIKTKED